MTKQIRYGTALFPFVTGKLKFEFPSADVLRRVDPDDESISVVGPAAMAARTDISLPSKGFPSVTQIVGCTEPQDALYRWQYGLITKLGKDGFVAHMTERMGSGRAFHAVVEFLLKELQAKGAIESNPMDVLKTKPTWEKYSAELERYFVGLGPFLKTLENHPNILTEQAAVHPTLYYQGRFDALISFNGRLTLVDWKTVSADSAKTASTEKKLLTDLYTYPTQLAAYIAAVNASAAFAQLPSIDQAAVVLAYEDRPDVEVVIMDADEIENQFHQFCTKLNRFWWEAERRPVVGGLIDFVYRPGRFFWQDGKTRKKKTTKN